MAAYFIVGKLCGFASFNHNENLASKAFAKVIIAVVLGGLTLASDLYVQSSIDSDKAITQVQVRVE